MRFHSFLEVEAMREVMRECVQCVRVLELQKFSELTLMCEKIQKLTIDEEFEQIFSDFLSRCEKEYQDYLERDRAYTNKRNELVAEYDLFYMNQRKLHEDLMKAEVNDSWDSDLVKFRADLLVLEGMAYKENDYAKFRKKWWRSRTDLWADEVNILLYYLRAFGKDAPNNPTHTPAEPKTTLDFIYEKVALLSDTERQEFLNTKQGKRMPDFVKQWREEMEKKGHFVSDKTFANSLWTVRNSFLLK